MSEINPQISISKEVNTKDDLDFQFLKEKGLEYIQRLSGSLWTDYNTHDPGVTILEMLCYAITDLGSRIRMPIEDLLSEKDGSFSEQFFTASEILSSHPINEEDYRKLFIDIDGVKNCWLKPYIKTVFADTKENKLSYDKDDFSSTNENLITEFNLKGLYSILIDFDEDENGVEPKDSAQQEIYEKIKILYHQNRSLCEDVVEVKKVDTHAISVCAEIEVEPNADEELIHAQVLRTIDKYFSPDLQFYSLEQMIKKGYTSDQIFEGPLLQNGFIDPVELSDSALRKEVRLSDIINLLMKINGIKQIKGISIGDRQNYQEETDVWIICVEEGKKPARCLESAYSYFKGVLPLNMNQDRVNEHLQNLEKEEKSMQEDAKHNKEWDIPVGTYCHPNETTSIQNEFPETYGIGTLGLSSRASKKRKALAKQLKGYLLFFDQIFASYFAHLGKVKDLLSVNSELKSSYFTQVVKDIEGFDDLVNSYPMNDDEELADQIFKELDQKTSRQNDLQDHLISRFAEQFSDYAFLTKMLYGAYSDEVILESKKVFLKDYADTSKHRAQAFNYYRQDSENLWNTENVSGIQKRIARLCGITNYNRRDLSTSFTEIYALTDSKGRQMYRWRIRNPQGKKILSASDDYHDTTSAYNEMVQAIVKILEVPIKCIEDAFENDITDEQEIGNFEIQQSDKGLYSFDIINPKADINTVNRIIARQFLYYETKEELKAALLEIIEFMKIEFHDEGMFLLEHIILRPDVTSNSPAIDLFLPINADEGHCCNLLDPYSFRITIVLPGWTYRFGNTYFREFLEELIRKELPAHILARICWVGEPKGSIKDEENDMLQFEQAYKAYLESKTDKGEQQDEEDLKKLIEAMNELNTIYRSGELIDCKEEDDSLEGKIILGQTHIGTL